MRATSLVMAVCLFAAPLTARAECHSAPECLSMMRLPRLDWRAAAVLGAAAAPAVLVGAFVTAAVQHATPPEPPQGVVFDEDEQGRPRARLVLVPTQPDPYYGKPLSEHPRPSGAFKFNDTATNVALAVGGAAIIGSVIAGIVGSKKR